MARSLVVTRKIHSHCVLGRGMHANVACWLVGPSRHFAAMQGLVAIDAQRTLANPRPVDLWVHGLIGSGPNTPRRSPDNAETATAVIATVRTRRRVADELALLSLCRVSAGIARITWRMEIAAPELAARSVGSVHRTDGRSDLRRRHSTLRRSPDRGRMGRLDEMLLQASKRLAHATCAAFPLSKSVGCCHQRCHGCFFVVALGAGETQASK